MKKLILGLAALAVFATAGFAATGVAIQWQTAYGIYDHAAIDLTSWTEGGILDSYAITWQLIYSIDANADAPSLANSANGWVSGDDEVWASRTFAQGNGTASDGTTWDMFVYYTGIGDRQYVDASWSNGDVGYIYQRIYEGAPALGSWYFDSALVGLDSDPITFQESYIEGSSGAPAGIQPNQQIPEPATMALLGLGALTLAIRRRRS